MKRYVVEGDDWACHETEDGEWVKWDDAAALIERLQDALLAADYLARSCREVELGLRRTHDKALLEHYRVARNATEAARKGAANPSPPANAADE